MKNIVQVDQDSYKKMSRFAIRNKQNLVIIGPSGVGKTEIAYQACEEENVRPIFWNLSVSERLDIQGLPKLSSDGSVSTYALPERLPTNGNYQELATIKKFLEVRLDGIPESVYQYLSDRKAQIINQNKINDIKNIVPYINSKELVKSVADVLERVQANTAQNISSVLIFDEVDKAPSEVLQPLLEVLQFKSINGTKLNIQSCLLTGNLPEEHTHSEQISHALTNRCMIVELKPDINIWCEWLAKTKKHPLIIEFFKNTEHHSFFHTPPGINDLYDYAYCTPRAWVDCSNILYALDKDPTLAGLLADDELSLFRCQLISSKVGERASVEFKTWTEHYKMLDPLIQFIFENGSSNFTHQNIPAALNFDQQLICAIGVCSRYNNYLQKEENLDSIRQKTALIFSWLLTQDTEIQTTMRFVLNDQLYISKKVVSSVPEAKEFFIKLRDLYEQNKIK